MTKEVAGNTGYIALRREVTEGVPAGIPNVFLPLYKESFTTEPNHGTSNSAFGSAFARLRITPGIRSHGGDLEVMAEPNSTQMWVDMTLPRTAQTGSAPITSTFGHTPAKPASYTLDISATNQVFRYSGVQAGELSPTWTDNEMRWNVKAAAIKSFLGAEIVSISTATVTLSTEFNSSPTELLLVGDLVSVWLQAGTRQDFTISSKTATTVTLSGTPTGVTSGDMLILRASTPNLSLLQSFLWSRTEFRLAATAATALAATHTPMEQGSEWVISNPFDEDKGAQRSGSFDPASMVRKAAIDVSLKLKRFFENPDEVRNFVGMKNLACVIRCFSGTQYELRITLNSIKTVSNPKPLVESDGILFYEIDYLPDNTSADGQGFDIKVISA